MEESKEEYYEIGLFHRFLKPSDEWLELTARARKNEQALGSRFPTREEQRQAACRLIAGENPALQEALGTAEETEAFIAACLALRGPSAEGPRRKLAREQARLIGYLHAGARLPDSAEAVLDLWECANRLEPRWYDEMPAHFRTPSDHVPFTRVGFKVVPPGMETARPEEIPGLVARLLGWLQRREVSPEALAMTEHHLFVYIHPFPDGNGHTARLFSCGLLAKDYSAPTLTAFLREIWKDRPLLCRSILADRARGGDLCPACCRLFRLLIRGQEQLLGDG